MIHTYLDLSTAHLSRETMDKLSHYPQTVLRTHMGWPAMTIAPYECGTFVTVPSEMMSEQMDALPSDLEEVLSYARGLGATVVRFDSDGATVAELPTHDW